MLDLRSMIFGGEFAAKLVLLSVALLACGSTLLIRNVLRKNTDYESFLSRQLRLLLYSIPYALVPVAGLGMGAFILATFHGRSAHRFGHSSLYLGFAYSLFYLGCWLSTPFLE